MGRDTRELRYEKCPLQNEGKENVSWKMKKKKALKLCRIKKGKFYETNL